MDMLASASSSVYSV